VTSQTKTVWRQSLTEIDSIDPLTIRFSVDRG